MTLIVFFFVTATTSTALQQAEALNDDLSQGPDKYYVIFDYQLNSAPHGVKITVGTTERSIPLDQIAQAQNPQAIDGEYTKVFIVEPFFLTNSNQTFCVKNIDLDSSNCQQILKGNQSTNYLVMSVPNNDNID